MIEFTPEQREAILRKLVADLDLLSLPQLALFDAIAKNIHACTASEDGRWLTFDLDKVRSRTP